MAVIISSFAVGTESKLREPAPSSSFDKEWVASGEDNTNHRPYIVITHRVGRPVDGDNIVIKDESGHTIKWENVWTGGPTVTAGEYVHIDGFGSDAVLDPPCEQGDSYFVILKSDDGKTLKINEWTAPSSPNLPSSASSDSNDDGIPDWC